jgi:hypothetical protein
MSFLNWFSIGNYIIAIAVTAAIILISLHYASSGRIWNTFSKNSYTCGMVKLLSDNETPNLTGLFSSEKDASSAIVTCNTPQAFYFDHKICTLKDGIYSCYPEPK